MTNEQVESEALKLEPEARAELAEKLLRSLEDLKDDELSQLWAEEAVRRDEDLDSGRASMRDAEDVQRGKSQDLMTQKVSKLSRACGT